MGIPFNPSPHVEGHRSPTSDAPNAALLIDFDNVTMGMRSDLSRELKSLLQSDVIKGKVTVQRAYADWRRYPQYIVPLSEASVDLIFAPAYGSSKKNATDIRMAIDGMELVFIRPEIGVYILLTGDSDFSSLVLKLKEYGKYVIGVGIQESSSDILVQNCDEYYSYTSLTGLRRTSDSGGRAADPWTTVTKALEKMVSRGDVMRSDRLKQVMRELDGNFDEGSFGFSKFSKFLAEASAKGLVQLHRLENGQYEVKPPRKRGGGGRSASRPQSRSTPAGEREAQDDDGPLKKAYALLAQALSEFGASGRDRVRDSDVKRKMLGIQRGFDEAELGFAKFSRFLRQASDDGIVELTEMDTGNFQVSLIRQSSDEAASSTQRDGAKTRDAGSRRGGRREETSGSGSKTPDKDVDSGAVAAGDATTRAAKAEPGSTLGNLFGSIAGRLGLRGGGGPKGGESKSGPKMFDGQVVAPRVPQSDPPKRESPQSETTRSEAPKREDPRRDAPRRDAPRQEDPRREEKPAAHSTDTPQSPPESGGDAGDLSGLGLPSSPESMTRYLEHRYKGVGKKTAETLVEALGTDLFKVLHTQPEKIRSLAPRRAEEVLAAWRSDYERRASKRSEGPNGS